jgi:hypothetical protein
VSLFEQIEYRVITHQARTTGKRTSDVLERHERIIDAGAFAPQAEKPGRNEPEPT